LEEFAKRSFNENKFCWRSQFQLHVLNCCRCGRIGLFTAVVPLAIGETNKYLQVKGKSDGFSLSNLIGSFPFKFAKEPSFIIN
jgi:hypothetical protein